jgi:outer membrane murein-binding lipoprotein Lpp
MDETDKTILILGAIAVGAYLLLKGVGNLVTAPIQAVQQAANQVGSGLASIGTIENDMNKSQPISQATATSFAEGIAPLVNPTLALQFKSAVGASTEQYNMAIANGQSGQAIAASNLANNLKQLPLLGSSPAITNFANGMLNQGTENLNPQATPINNAKQNSNGTPTSDPIYTPTQLQQQLIAQHTAENKLRM